MPDEFREEIASFRAVLLAIAGLLGVGAGTLAYAWGVEPDRIEVSRIRLRLPRLSPRFNGYRLVQISDIHAGEWLPTRRLQRVVDMVNDERPDLVAVTGDFVTYTHKGAHNATVPALKRLCAKDGVAAVMGNHDFWGYPGPVQVRHIIRDSGMIDLNNRVHTLRRDGEMLHICGVNTAKLRRDRLDWVLARLPEEGAAILLAHEPDVADKTAATGRFDLQISGHSHGGQIVLPVLGPPRLPPLGRKYPTGLYKVGDMALYTNRGLGMVGLPMRFLARPEISVFTLEAGV
ncbi:MAG: metallophosphoesterase [Chloroflexia bacterium]